VNIRFNKHFPSDIRKKVPAPVAQRVEKLIDELRQTPDLRTLSNVKALAGHPGYFRIRVGEYRIGFRLVENEIHLMRILHRREIYRYFP
jgi:mRNA interferase RelE/StbE